MGPCGVRQARWKRVVVVVVEALTYEPMKGKITKTYPQGLITRLYPEVCMERGSSGVVTLQTW